MQKSIFLFSFLFAKCFSASKRMLILMTYAVVDFLEEGAIGDWWLVIGDWWLVISDWGLKLPLE